MFSFNLQRFARVMTVVDGKVVEFLPVATTSDRGGVVIGDGVSVDNSGKISIPESTTVKSGLISSTDKTKLNGIATGAQVNVIEKVQVNNTDLAITNKSVNIDISNKVDKVSGKTLSSNDYTTTEKNKLSGIASGAQVNVIEKISIDGVNQSINSKTATLNLDAYAKKSDIASGVRIKGSVNSFSDLPSNAVTGDLYNIKTAGGTDGEGVAIKAGDNVIKTEDGKWDVMAGAVDLSNYVKKDGSKVLSTNDYTTEEKNKLSGIASNAQVNVIETVKVNGTTLTPSNKAVNIDISGKVDKVSGKQLSTNDYTTNEKNKLAGIANNANNYSLPVATASTIGGVMIDSATNSNIVLGTEGNISVPPATTTQAGVIKYGGGTTNYLRADGSWAKPPNTTYSTASTTKNGLMSSTDKTKLDGIATNAQVNIIETVKINGTALTPSDKAVDIDISNKVDKVSGKGLSTNDYTTAEKNKLSNVASGAQVNIIETVKVNDTALAITDKAVNIDISGKVDKVSGKGLSTNDYTTNEKNKLAGIASGAQVNIIESISIDGTNQNISSKKVTLNLSDYAKKSDIASGIRIKGSVNSFSDLPTDAVTGDLYNIKTAGGTDGEGIAIRAGDNVVRTENGKWDVMAGTVDLSNYVQKDGSKVLSTNDYTTTEKNKLAGIASNAQVNVIETVKVNGTALTPSSKAVNIDISGKVDKVSGKALSTNDYTTTEKNKLANIASGAQVNVIETVKVNGTALTPSDKAVNIDISGKVDKVSGKSLSTNDYTTAEKNKLAGIDEQANKYILPVATSSTIGGVKIDSVANSNIVLGADGSASVPTASTSQAGVIKYGGGTSNYLRADGQWAIPPNTTYSAMSGASSSAAGAAGLVPAPAKGKQTSFLRGDGTWVIPTNTTYAVMTGASSSEAGASGLVPTPAKGKQASFLRGDGTWAVPTNTTYAVATESANGLLSSADKKTINGLANTYLGKTAKAASATTADSATTATKATGDKNGADITTTYAKLAGAAFTGGITGTTATFSGTLTLTKTTDLSGTANNSPALIIGGAATKAHIEIDGNEIHAKGNDSTTAALYINNDGGTVNIGEGGVSVKGDISAAGKTITAGTFKGNLTGNVTGNVSGSSGSCTGNSATTTKFASAQTITLSGDVTGSVSSQAGWTINTKRRTCIVGQSGSTSTNPWYKVASCTLNANSLDYVVTFLVQHHQSTTNGILKIRVRRDTDKMGACTATWLINNGFDEDNFVIVSPSSGYSPELWVKIASSYTRYIFTVLSENTNGSVGQYWNFYPANTAGQSDSITTAGTQNTSTMLNIKNNASTATTATKLATGRTLKVSLSSTAASTAFDGSANIANIGVAGILPVANGGTGQTVLSAVTVGKATTVTNATTGYAEISTAATATVKSATISNLDIRKGTLVALANSVNGNSSDSTEINLSINGISYPANISRKTQMKNSQWVAGYYLFVFHGSLWLCLSHP